MPSRASRASNDVDTSKELVYYPIYVIERLSQTWRPKEWGRLTLRDLASLTQPDVYKGTGLFPEPFFHLNHAINSVQVTAMITCVTPYERKSRLYLDDGSGVTLPVDLDHSLKNEKFTGFKCAPGCEHRLHLRPGMIINVKGIVQRMTIHGEQYNTMDVKFVHLVTSTDEEMRLMAKLVAWKKKYWGKPWIVDEKELQKVEKAHRERKRELLRSGVTKRRSKKEEADNGVSNKRRRTEEPDLFAPIIASREADPEREKKSRIRDEAKGYRITKHDSSARGNKSRVDYRKKKEVNIFGDLFAGKDEGDANYRIKDERPDEDRLSMQRRSGEQQHDKEMAGTASIHGPKESRAQFAIGRDALQSPKAAHRSVAVEGFEEVSLDEKRFEMNTRLPDSAKEKLNRTAKYFSERRSNAMKKDPKGKGVSRSPYTRVSTRQEPSLPIDADLFPSSPQAIASTEVTANAVAEKDLSKPNAPAETGRRKSTKPRSSRSHNTDIFNALSEKLARDPKLSRASTKACLKSSSSSHLTTEKGSIEFEPAGMFDAEIFITPPEKGLQVHQSSTKNAGYATPQLSFSSYTPTSYNTPPDFDFYGVEEQIFGKGSLKISGKT